MYELVVPNPDKGDYQLEVIATKDGKELGRQKLNFTVIPPADEMLKIAANPQLLTSDRQPDARLSLQPRAVPPIHRSTDPH